MNLNRLILALLTTTAFLPHVALADNVSAAATASATVQPTGPRTGTSGTNFFNVEGTNNGNPPGSLASFGVLDFGVSAFNLAFPATAVTSLTLSLTESNAAFTTANGGLNFYLVTDTTTSIATDGTSPLKFLSANAPEGLGTQLGATPYLLGSGTFSSNSGANGSGTVDTYTFSLSSDVQTYIISQLNTPGSTLRLVVAPTDAAGASTWAGATNATVASRPLLTLNVALGQAALTWKGGAGTWNATGGTDWSGGAWDSTKQAIFGAGSGTVTLGTPVTATGVKFDAGGYTVAGSGANALTLSSDTGGNVVSVSNAGDTATISAVISGTSGLQKSGAGTLALTGANTFTGNVTLSGGALVISADANLGAVSNGIVLNSGTLKSASAITVAATRTLSGSGSLDGTGGLINFTGAVAAESLTITGGTVQFSGPSAAFTSAAVSAGSQLTITAPITSTVRTTFSGDGTVALNGNNTSFTGGVTTARGTGSVGPTLLLGSATALGVEVTRLNAGTLQASTNLTGANAVQTTISLGGNATIAGSDIDFASGFGLFGTTAKRLTVLNNTTISSSIASTGTTNVGDALIKTGSGKLTLSATNGYTGGTQILSGTVEVTSTGILGTGDVTIAAESAVAAVLRLDANTTIDDLSNIFILNSLGLSQLDLNFSSALFETVKSLTINGNPIAPGDYNASTLPGYLTGTGNLRVLSVVPEPGTTALLILGGGCALAMAGNRRRRSASLKA